jgi:hypothetical protein
VGACEGEEGVGTGVGMLVGSWKGGC